MAVEERNLNSLEWWDSLIYNDDDYTEEEFSKFLKRTKENLAKMTINKKDSSDGDSSKSDRDFSEFLRKTKQNLAKMTISKKETSDEEGSKCDKDFSKFLTQLKSCSSANQSICNTYAVPNRNQRSFSASTPKSGVKSNNSIFEEKRSLSTSILSLAEMEEQSDKDFSKKRFASSKKLYKLFNEKIFDNKLPQDLELVWTNGLKTTAGKTYASRKENKYHSCKISLSSAVLTTFERLRDTLLHEMCHAAVFVISQIRESSHGPLWQTWAARCNLIFPDIKVPQRCHDYEISFPYYYKCNKCSWKIGRCRISEKLSKALCPNCRHTGFESKLSLIKS